MKTKAAILYETGQPLRVEEIALPELQPGQILVKVKYSGVCHSQLMEVRGKRGIDRYLPHLLGHEGSGEVLDVGAEVKKVAPGDKVVLTWIKGEGADCVGTQYRKGDMLINAGGVTTFNDYSVVSENRCIKLPDGMPMDVASLLGCAVLTGAGIVLNTMKPQKDSSIVIWGVGGIGMSALMAANLCECSPIIALDTQESKLALAKDFGATHVINVKSEKAMERIYQIAGAAGVDYAVEAAGNTSAIEQAFQSVRKNGGLCVFASHPPEGEKICLPPHELISGKRIRGSWGGESKPDQDIPRFVEMYKQGKLPLEKLITHRYSLEQINLSLDDLEEGNVGRALIEFHSQ